MADRWEIYRGIDYYATITQTGPQLHDRLVATVFDQSIAYRLFKQHEQWAKTLANDQVHQYHRIYVYMVKVTDQKLPDGSCYSRTVEFRQFTHRPDVELFQIKDCKYCY